MPSFTVQSAEVVKTLPPKDGRKPMHVHRMAFSDGQRVEWLSTQEQPVSAGSTLEGDVTPSDNPAFLPRFKKAQQGFGGGGTRKTDPADAARMLRCHSQEIGVRLARLWIETGRIEPGKFDWDMFVKLVDRLDADVKKAAQGV